jgi:putative membrane protein
MMGHYGYGMGWIGMIIGLIFTIAIVVGIVLLIVWASRKSNGTTTQSGRLASSSQSAREIAQSRYAKGEISREEYQQILSDIDR